MESCNLDSPERLRALAETQLMDSPSEEQFDRLVRIAQRVLEVPIVLISLVDDERQFFKAAVGLQGDLARERQTPVTDSICQHLVNSGAPLCIENAESHPLLCDNTAVRDMGIRSYLGFPLVTAEGHTLGSLCAVTVEPRQWSEADKLLLQDIAELINNRIELRTTQHRYREIEERMQKLSSHVPGVIYQFLMRPDGTYAFPYASEGIRAIYGVSPDEVREDAAPAFAVIHPDDLAAVAESIQTSAADLTRWQMEYRVQYKDGKTEWLLGDSMPERLVEGGTLWHGYIVNISESKRQQAKLKESMNRFRQSYEYAGIGMATLDINGQVLTANPALLSMLGYTMDEMRTITLKDLTHPEDLHLEPDLERKLLDREIPVGRVTKRIRRSDQSHIWGRLTTTIIRDEAEQAKEFTCQIEDVTALREAANERANLDRQLADTAKLESLGVLAGGIAHDFNNLLTGVLGNASLLKIDLPRHSPQAPLVEQIEIAARRAADLCRQMLAYSGKGRFVIRSIDLNSVIKETAQLLEISISKQTSLHFHLSSNLPPVEADETQLRQIVMNLVINGSEAITQQSGVVTLSTGFTFLSESDLGSLQFGDEMEAGSHVWLEVTDNGCGMPTEVFAKMFEPFFTTKFAGRGLGLAALQGIVRGHKGGIHVRSAVGQGTTFRTYFPAATKMPHHDEPLASSVRPTTGRGTVLLVDDEPTVRDVTSRILAHAGFDVEKAVDGLMGLECFTRQPNDYVFVLLDLTMPNLDGLETFRRMRKLNPKVPLLLMSGYDHADTVRSFEGEGPASFIAKPLNRDSLLNAVETLLSR